MINSKAVIRSIKSELRKRGINYKKLSQQLKISESATKKMFANKNFSLHRLDAICEVLGLDLLELAERGAESVEKITQLTVEQESKIFSDSKFFIVTYAAMNYWSVEDITRRYKFTEAEAIKYLLQLEKFGFLELGLNNRVRPLLSLNFQWIPGGPAEKFYREHFLPNFFNSNFKDAGSQQVVRNGDLSDESKVLLDQRVQQLGDFFDELCFKDRHKKPGNMERKGTSMVLAFRTWTLPVFAEYARD